MDIMKECYGEEESSGKKMAGLDALKKLKKFIAEDWMKKHMEKMESGAEVQEGVGEITAEDLAETGEEKDEDSPESVREELMKYMKPKVKERHPGTAMMIAIEKKAEKSSEKKGSKKKMG